MLVRRFTKLIKLPKVEVTKEHLRLYVKTTRDAQPDTLIYNSLE